MQGKRRLWVGEGRAMLAVGQKQPVLSVCLYTCPCHCVVILHNWAGLQNSVRQVPIPQVSLATEGPALGSWDVRRQHHQAGTPTRAWPHPACFRARGFEDIRTLSHALASAIQHTAQRKVALPVSPDSTSPRSVPRTTAALF